jgi:hypothetical protein
MTKAEAPALRALLHQYLDYAGVFPPAALSLDSAVSNYQTYRQGPYSWMLRSLVVPAAELERVPANLDGALALLGEADDDRAATVETTKVITAKHPVYCQVALDKVHDLDAVKAAGCFGKMRTGGLLPEALPSCAQVAQFIVACARRKLAFKATAGLHHPIRSMQSLTYEDNAPRAVMHGFINVLMAAAFAWHGDEDIEGILSETDPQAFVFADGASWKERSLSAEQVRDARLNFIHSIGSCSFEEPVQELQALGLLPLAQTAKL